MLLRCFIFFTLVNVTIFPGQCQNYLQTGLGLFDAVKAREFDKADKLMMELAMASEETLIAQLDTGDKGKAFWLNIYNTYVQYFLQKEPARFNDRSSFFQDESITIAGKKLSLEDIEHGIIRRSRNKYSFGYVGSIFVDDFEKRFRLETIDYRIHFALNCGARSCPPVARYTATDLDAQLDKSTKLYLKSVARYDARKNIVRAPAVCSWFEADFGGEDGVIKMMKDYRIVPTTQDPDVEYLPYDWDLKLANYITL